MLHDLVYAARILAKDRGTTALAILALALGIGANATLFSLVDALYLRPLPVPDAGRIVRAYELLARGDAVQTSLPDYLYYREHLQAFEDLAAHYSSSPLHVVVGNEPVAVTGSVVTASYFTVLRIRPHLGRFFTVEEDSFPDRDAVAVISYRFWLNRLGADPQVIGRSIDVNGRAFTIVGVAPRDFDGVTPGGTASQVWIPSAMFRVGYRYCDAFARDCTVVDMIGRLKASATIEQAQTGFSLLAEQLEAAYPRRDARRHRTIGVRPAMGVYPAQQSANASVVRLLFGGVSLLLLIACANVAGLMLARGLSRRREIAVRLALGASRGTVVRQLFIESALLAAVGSGLGLIVSSWAMDVVSAFYVADYAGRLVDFDMTIGATALGATATLCGLTAVLCGIAPALQAARTDVMPALKLEGVSGRRPRTRTRDALVVAQMAMSIVLLVGAGLLVRSMIDLARGPGVDANRILLLRLRPSLVDYGGERARRFQRNVIDRLESIPGVEAAATSENLPLFLGGSDVTVREDSADRRKEIGGVRASHVGDGYFDVLGLSLLAGRDFNNADRVGSRPVAIVDATLAAALGGNDVVGRRVTIDGEAHEIVGVVPAAQFRKALEPLVPYLYLNYWQQTGEGFAADSRTHVRVAGDAAVILPRLRREISALDRNVPISEDYPLRDRVGFTFQPVRMAMTMLVYFGGVALVLSLVGVYGVVSSVASMRTREVAVRLALGASPIQIGALMARHGLRLVVPGVILGVVAAFYSTRALQSLLYGVALHDPATFVSVPLILIGVALLATVGPVRRAMGVDPAVTLRNE